MKKIIALMLSATLMFAISGCNGNAEDTGDKGDAGDTGEVAKTKVTCIVGIKSDKSFFESANEGMERAQVELAEYYDISVVEMGIDPTKYKDALYAGADSDAEIVIVGSYNMIEHLEEVAPQYPDKKFIIFDASVDYADGFENVLSIGYAANEASFLAGVAAANYTISTHENANEDKVIGFIGGVENNPVITDFLVGFIEGIQFVDSEIKVTSSYIGNFNDTAKGKELALVQYNQEKADLIFAVCGPASTGVIEAGFETGNLVLGVDSDQSLLYEGRDEQSTIMTSALKRIDNSLFKVLEDHIKGEVPYGEYIVLGLSDESVGLVYNDIFKSYISEDVITTINETQDKIISGDIKVSSSRELDLDAVDAIINTAK